MLRKAEQARVSWIEAEPLRLEAEVEAMNEKAPEMKWVDGGAGRWEGLAPIWPFDRDEPEGLSNLLKGRRLELSVECLESHPMVAPRVFPLDPSPPRKRRILEKWHLNGDGTICLLFSSSNWSGREYAAELVLKSSGWFIEYLLVEAGDLRLMTQHGPGRDIGVDRLLSKYV